MNTLSLPDIDYEHHPAYRTVEPLPGNDVRKLRTEYESALFAVLDSLRPYAAYWSNISRKSVDGPWRSLAGDGIAVGQLSPELKDKAREAFDHYLGDSANPETFMDVHRLGREDFKDPANSKAIQLVQGMLGLEGMSNAILSYLGTSKVGLQTIHFKRHRSTETDRDFPFPDMPELAGPGSGLHIDILPQVVKIMIYLSPVETVENGPFRYVKGSHAEHVPILGYAIRQTTNRFAAKRDEHSRRLLMSLPPIYRNKCYFGEDMLEDDPRLLELLSAEMTCLSMDGDCVLFDPGGIHRGNDVRSKTPREVIQISFRGMR